MTQSQLCFGPLVRDAWILNSLLVNFTPPNKSYVSEDSAEITFMHINHTLTELECHYQAVFSHAEEAPMRAERMHQKLFLLITLDLVCHIAVSAAHTTFKRS